MVLGTDLTGKMAVVTGAGGILCGMFARTLARAGAAVALLDINLEAAEETARDIREAGGTAAAYGVDVMDKEMLESVHARVLARLGPCDILINGAGGNQARANTSKEYFEMGDIEADVATFFDMEYKGAQPKEYITKPTIKEFQYYQKVAKGLIKYVTLAPEVDDEHELTEYLFKNGVVVSMGHSAATYEEAIMGFAHGARSQTHVYNGMTPFNHRKNGLVGAAYRVKGMYGEVICDGNHSTVAALYNFFNAKGPDYGIMVTDALMAKGFEPGTKFIFGGNEIEIYEDGSAHLVETKGLAGSTLRMNEGLRILVEEAMVPFNYAINACTINPAKCLRIDMHKGRIGVGYDSDLVVLNDDYSVHQTYCLGKVML